MLPYKLCGGHNPWLSGRMELPSASVHRSRSSKPVIVDIKIPISLSPPAE